MLETSIYIHYNPELNSFSKPEAFRKYCKEWEEYWTIKRNKAITGEPEWYQRSGNATAYRRVSEKLEKTGNLYEIYGFIQEELVTLTEDVKRAKGSIAESTGGDSISQITTLNLICSVFDDYIFQSNHQGDIRLPLPSF